MRMKGADFKKRVTNERKEILNFCPGKEKTDVRETYYMITGLISAAVAYVSGKMGILIPLLGILLLMMVVDYITGMLASMKEAVDHPGDAAYGWSSAEGFNGIIRKVSICAVITVAITLDYVIAVMTKQLGVDPPKMAFIGLLVIAWFLLNEMLSIIENAGRMGGDVPAWLAKYIAVLKHRIDEAGVEEDE